MANSCRFKVIVGEPTGFCSGVKRAIAIVKREAKKAKGSGEVFTLGPIIHNSEVVNELKILGVKTIAVQELKNQRVKIKAHKPVVIIRSHGCAPEIIANINKLGCRVVDATCRYVKRVQNVAAKLKDNGYLTIVVGDKKHPEVKGIIGYAKPLAKVYHVDDFEACPGDRPGIRRLQTPFRVKRGISLWDCQGPKRTAQRLRRLSIAHGRVGIIGQTTIPSEYFQSAINSFNVGNYEEIRVFNTLCKESQARQKTCKKIANRVELMIIVGSRNSANTGTLANIARSSNTKVYQVEKKEELYKIPLRPIRVSPITGKAKMIGVIAGASTPQNTIFEVVKEIKKILKQGEVL